MPAFYAFNKSNEGKKQYIRRLVSLGFSKKEAVRLLDFECSSIVKFDKAYLLDGDFTKSWLFGLYEPIFTIYPKEKDDILKEHFFTVSELAKIMDEAEWHFYNSHEKNLSAEVLAEIYEWHIKGTGGEFGIKYFEMISNETDIPIHKLSKYCQNEGLHLSMYKW